MSLNLWHNNTPERFWRCLSDISQEEWESAAKRSLPILGFSAQDMTIEQILAATLGEGQFGENHWQLSPIKQVYYTLKPLLPRSFTTFLKKLNKYVVGSKFLLKWPVEERFAAFQYDIMYQMLKQRGIPSVSFARFWPNGHRYAFVLTHDVEDAHGQASVREVAAVDEYYGFRSSFNFVPERYPLDHALIAELVERGFEVGVHGLRHDGKLFRDHREFTERAPQINAYLKKLNAVGFRAPMTHRHPYWMQELNVEYDLSFFDTDPYEPLPGGTMSIWPFFLGHFVELPYTLVQDSTLVPVLGETSPRLWLEKVNFIEQFGGMALVNTHPDYVHDKTIWAVYEAFLAAMRDRRGYWHALPRDVARWWRIRDEKTRQNDDNVGSITIQGQSIVID